ncbi:MAG: hypothetical protein FOGNACKC_00718 [Anaerolineae bacterium]|nr:hypothetical protein [Anaerolineae bacterium]
MLVSVDVTQKPPHGRGCGKDRSEGMPYACCGLSKFGRPIEFFLKDEAALWATEWKRGSQVLPRNPGDPNTVYDLYIFISKKDYPSPTDFWMEASRFGVSRKISPSQKFELLTPGVSQMRFVHARSIPKFDYVLSPPENGQTGPLYGCKFQRGEDADFSDKTWANVPRGYHPDGQPCTHALRDLAVLLHPDAVPWQGGDKQESREYFQITNASTTYTGRYPILPSAGEELEWATGVFMALPLTHFEFCKKADANTQERLNKTGYSAVTLDY